MLISAHALSRVNPLTSETHFRTVERLMLTLTLLEQVEGSENIVCSEALSNPLTEKGVIEMDTHNPLTTNDDYSF